MIIGERATVSSIPTPFTLRVRSTVAGEPDEFGNPTVTTAEHDWQVHGIAPGAMSDPTQANRDVSLIAYTVLAPRSADTPTESDEVMVDGEWFAVNGRPSDWGRGPWGFPSAGVTVELSVANG